ncbi:MAG: fused MFS/spermidine synthase, partial [Burkholderiales bacterium]|nr:fused MFS/spermidine synthase [Burkholderiales bacterium]
MLPYALTIFLSAFLLFLVQPLIAKQILPWFGGAASVWTTCLLFFQSALLAGYAYADASVRWLKPRQQLVLHALLLAVSLATLPIIADAAWKPAGDEDPILRILGLLAATIGLPYLLLSTTTPLLQAWYWQRFNTSVPYRLFALSNLASLLALLGYPVLVEPFFGVAASAKLWSALYALFALVCVATGWHSVRHARARELAAGADAAAAAPAPAPGALRLLSWLVLSATGSCVLLAVSNHITQNIASVPFLWVLPLALYLITFIICFDHPRWYSRAVFMPLLAACVLAMAWQIDSLQLKYVLPLFALGLFAACMFCHGELARQKPDPRHLTLYYLMMSVGGALGALLVAIGAPLALRGYFELHIVLVVLALLLAAGVWRVLPDAAAARWVFRAGALLVVAGVVRLDALAIEEYTRGVREMDRNFYGVVRTRDQDDPAMFRTMYHGGINHGGQLMEPGRTMEPTSYFSRSSGYGRLLENLPGPRRIGVIGLGAGALLTHSREGDLWVFYEIDPVVVDIAAREFTFQKETRAKVEVVLGDGRLALEREAPRQYDMLGIDAFSGDSIPMHLITREAMAAYVRHLKPDGAIVFQATNRFVDLMPVIR